MLFLIPGPPIGKARPRVVKGHAYTPERTRTHEATIALLARNALALSGGELIIGPVAVSVCFFLRDHQTESDLDNYVKAVLDGMNGIVYVDDKQVVSLHAWKRIDKAFPRTTVEVMPMIVWSGW